MAPGTPIDKKEIIQKTLRKRGGKGKKKTNVPINLPIRNSSSHAIIQKSHKGKEMGGSDTQARKWKGEKNKENPISKRPEETMLDNKRCFLSSLRTG